MPLGFGGFVGLVGDDHHQDESLDLAAGLLGGGGQALVVEGEGGRRVDADAETEGVIGILGRESQAFIRTAGADQLHGCRGLRADPAIGHLEILALEVRHAGIPQIAQDLGIFRQHAVALGVVLLARPQAHLVIFGLLPAGDQIDAETAVGDGVDGVGHPRADRRRDGERRDGGEYLDLLGDGGKAGHQRETLEIMLPELGLAAESAQLDHREGEIEAVFLGLDHDLLVEVEARHILRSILGDQPAIVADRNENADFHDYRPAFSRKPMR